MTKYNFLKPIISKVSKFNFLFLSKPKSITCIALFFLIFSNQKIIAQKISLIDVIKVDAKYEKEALFFFNENWKAYRNEALNKGFISGFELQRTSTDSSNHFQIILITEFADSITYRNVETNFEPIMKRISPNGPKMLNSVSRKEILEYVIGYETLSIINKRNKKAIQRKDK